MDGCFTCDKAGPSGAGSGERPDWTRLWAYARISLGLTKEEFYDQTPRSLEALTKERARIVEHDEFMLAQLTAYSINFSFRSPREAVKPGELMPSQQVATAKPTRMTQQSKALAIRETMLRAFKIDPSRTFRPGERVTIGG